MMIMVFAIAGLRRRRRGWQFVRAIRLSLVRGEPPFERDMMVSCFCAAPPLVTTVFSSPLSVFLTERPFAIDTHTLCAVGFGLGFQG